MSDGGLHPGGVLGGGQQQQRELGLEQQQQQQQQQQQPDDLPVHAAAQSEVGCLKSPSG